MAKTNKEITSDIICSYMNSLSSGENGNPLSFEDLPLLIETVYYTVSNLENSDTDI